MPVYSFLLALLSMKLSAMFNKTLTWILVISKNSFWGLYNTPTATLQRGKTPTPNECPVYDTKQSDGEVLVMLGIWGIRSTSSLPLLPAPLWPGMVAPDRALSMG